MTIHLTITPFVFIVLALAVWRVSSLFANESGPANIFGKLRAWADAHSAHNPDGSPKAGSLIDGLSCEWCNSIWFGTLTIIAYTLAPTVVFWVYTIFAMSTVVIMLKFFREMLEHHGK